MRKELLFLSKGGTIMIFPSHLTRILEKHYSNKIDYSQIIYESYILFTSELDKQFLPENYTFGSEQEVVVTYFSYKEVLVYILSSPTSHSVLLTGLIADNKLKRYIID